MELIRIVEYDVLLLKPGSGFPGFQGFSTLSKNAEKAKYPFSLGKK